MQLCFYILILCCNFVFFSLYFLNNGMKKLLDRFLRVISKAHLYFKYLFQCIVNNTSRYITFNTWKLKKQRRRFIHPQRFIRYTTESFHALLWILLSLVKSDHIQTLHMINLIYIHKVSKHLKITQLPIHLRIQILNIFSVIL